ncbi:MAG: ABC transporter permease [Rhodococcus sp. (in: high G+C Gram-positive bacteria)]|uniref:ABC transporter permease n=1 Tax=Rhodococcus sp. TaxID=1831 RepID=UPI003BAE6C06
MTVVVTSRPAVDRSRWLKAVPFAFVLALAVIAPRIAPQSTTTVVGAPSEAPSAEHLFGTDSFGMDVFSRVLAATRLDIGVGLAVTVLATVAALAIGILTGMNEHRPGPIGRCARVVGRSIDLVQAVPVMVAGLVLLSFFGRTTTVLVISLAVILMPMQVRLVRVEVLRVRNETYIDAARMSGLRELQILVRHVLPNSAAPALENTSAIFGMAIIFCAGLGFLGVGIPVPTPEWGSMLASGATDAAVGRWWAAFFPACALAIAVATGSGFSRALFAKHH